MIRLCTEEYINVCGKNFKFEIINHDRTPFYKANGFYTGNNTWVIPNIQFYVPPNINSNKGLYEFLKNKGIDIYSDIQLNPNINLNL